MLLVGLQMVLPGGNLAVHPLNTVLKDLCTVTRAGIQYKGAEITVQLGVTSFGKILFRQGHEPPALGIGKGCPFWLSIG